MFREHTTKGKNNKNIKIKHPVCPSEAYLEQNFQCFDLHQVLFTLDKTECGSKTQRACSDVLLSLNNPVNFCLLECAFNGLLTTDFRLVLDRLNKFLNHKMLICVCWTANVRCCIQLNRKCPIFSFGDETSTCIIERIILSQYPTFLS